NRKPKPKRRRPESTNSRIEPRCGGVFVSPRERLRDDRGDDHWLAVLLAGCSECVVRAFEPGLGFFARGVDGERAAETGQRKATIVATHVGLGGAFLRLFQGAHGAVLMRI